MRLSPTTLRLSRRSSRRKLSRKLRSSSTMRFLLLPLSSSRLARLPSPARIRPASSSTLSLSWLPRMTPYSRLQVTLTRRPVAQRPTRSSPRSVLRLFTMLSLLRVFLPAGSRRRLTVELTPSSSTTTFSQEPLSSGRNKLYFLYENGADESRLHFLFSLTSFYCKAEDFS